MVSLLRLKPLSVPSVTSFFAAGFFRRRLPFLSPPLVPRLAIPPRRLLAPRSTLSFSSQRASMEPEFYMFGPYKIHKSEVFYKTELSFVMVNLRPVLPGHVLVCPKREVKRFVDLSADEVKDLWLTAKEVGGRLERHHEASSLTFTIQDGPEAGQSVPHVHIHILPRKKGDFENNDEIYDEIDAKERDLMKKLDLDKERKDRTSEEMVHEAAEYRALLS